MAYRIAPPDIQYLEVYLNEEKKDAKRVPTAGSLPAPWLIRYNRVATLPDDERGAAYFEFFYDLFHHYVGEKVELMTADQLNQLAEAWAGDTEEQDGATPGE